MKWFKHDSDAFMDAKLKKLILKYGAQGYGIYWYCLEQIARNFDTHNLTFELEHDAELIAHEFNISADLVQHIMTYMVELGLFEMGAGGIITCLKLGARFETSQTTNPLMRKVISEIKLNNHDTVMTKSCDSHDSVMKDKIRLDKIRLDIKDNKEKIIKKESYSQDFETFWKAYPRAKAKSKSFESWKKKKPNIEQVLKTLTWQIMSRDWQKGFIPNSLTYINQERWDDEPTKDITPNPFKFEE